PRDVVARGVGIDLIEQVPGVRVAVEGAGDLRPAQLNVHRRAGDIIAGHGAAPDRLVQKSIYVLPDHDALGRLGVEDVDPEFRRSRRRTNVDLVHTARGERQVTIRVEVGGAHSP